MAAAEQSLSRGTGAAVAVYMRARLLPGFPCTRRPGPAGRRHDRGTGRAHLGAVAAARAGRRGHGLPVALPVGSPHRSVGRVQAPVARDLDLAHGAGGPLAAPPLRAHGVADHLLPPRAAGQDGGVPRSPLRRAPRPGAGRRLEPVSYTHLTLPTSD